MSNGIDRAYASPVFARYEPPSRADRGSASEDAVDENTLQPASAGGSGGSQASAQTASNSDNFFGEDGFSFRDVLDALNPLNHIPIVSGMLEDATGHKVSTGSKLLGGLMTGPVGFIASLANAVFEQGTGKGVAESMVASLSGEHSDTDIQVAAADTAKEEMEVAQNAVPVDAVEVSSSSDNVAKAATPKPVQVALNDSARDQTLLDLYGGSVPSAHRSYKNAQMRTYLSDVTHSQVL